MALLLVPAGVARIRRLHGKLVMWEVLPDNSICMGELAGRWTGRCCRMDAEPVTSSRSMTFEAVRERISQLGTAHRFARALGLLIDWPNEQFLYTSQI